MYLSLRSAPATTTLPIGTAQGPRPGRAVSGTVVLLGTVSMLTDISSESVAAVLPLYLTAVLGLSPLAYGVVDGVQQGASALVRILGGWAADRTDRPKWVAFAGYALSAVTRAALLPAQGLTVVTGVLTLDRLGKGLRTAPRDAVIVASSPPEHLGRAFGVHRAMDTAGAVVGPLLAFGLLAAVPRGYHVVFVVSLAFALTGLAVLGLLVPDVRARPPAAPPAGTRTVRRALAADGTRRLLVVAGLLGLLTVGDGFLYLLLQRRDGLAAELFPLLYVGTNTAYLLLAVPLGRTADRVGRARVLVLGHVALAGAYLCASGLVSGLPAVLGCLALLGVFYAATDGVLAALAGRLVPPELRATGIATAQTVVAGARTLSSLLFGVAWTVLGREHAVLAVAALLAVAVPVALLVLRPLDRAPA